MVEATYLEVGVVEAGVLQHGCARGGQVQRHLAKHQPSIDKLHVCLPQLKQNASNAKSWRVNTQTLSKYMYALTLSRILLNAQNKLYTFAS